MDVAAALGAGCVVVAPGRRNGRSYEETRDYAARALTEVFERATQPDVRLAVEPIIAWQSDYLNTLGEAVELVELVGHPNLGVYPDSFHLWRTGTLLEDVERAAGRIFGVHLNDAVAGDDNHNRLPGEGELPLVEIVRAIEATGYRGTYDNELMDPSLGLEPAEIVDRCARAMVAVLGEAGCDARRLSRVAHATAPAARIASATLVSVGLLAVRVGMTPVPPRRRGCR